MALIRLLSLIAGLALLTSARGAVKDAPFKQDLSIQYRSAPELQDAGYFKLVLNRAGVPYVLTDKGVARLFDSTLALDRSFRPLADRTPVDIAGHDGEVFYLYDDLLIGNGAAGKFLITLPAGTFNRVTFADDGAALLAGDGARKR